jgi:hypothetical protein
MTDFALRAGIVSVKTAICLDRKYIIAHNRIKTSNIEHETAMPLGSLRSILLLNGLTRIAITQAKANGTSMACSRLST